MARRWRGSAALLIGLVLGTLVAPAPSATGQEFPTRPVKIINPWVAGGSSDTLSRIVAAKLSDLLGQQVVVENRAGATGTLGAASVAKGPADGYTLLLTTNSSYAMAPHLYKDLPYDNATAFAPISLIARSTQILCVHPSFPATDLKGFLAHVRANPEKVPFSTAGYGASSHLATELLMMLGELKMLHVPYKGGAPSVQAVVAGETALSFVDAITAIPFVKAGQLRALGGGTLTRATMMPELPTIAEAGLPGFESATDFALFTPAGTPAAVAAKLAAGMHALLADTETRERIRTQGLDVVDMGPDRFGAYFAAETEKWGRVIRTRNVKIE